MTLVHVLLSIHILAVTLWIGGAAAGTLIGLRLRSAGEAGAMGAFCNAFAQVAGPLFGGSAVIVLITGIWLVASGDTGYEFSATFVSIGFVGWLVSMVLGATVVGRSWYKIGVGLNAEGATLAALDGAITKATRWTALDLAIRVAVVCVMVWKPV